MVHLRSADLLAAMPLLPPGGMFSGLTACAAWGLWLPPRPDTAFDVCVPGTSRGSRRDELAVTRVAHPPAPAFWDGVPVAPLGEALLSAASGLSVLDVVVLVDSALRTGHVDATTIGEVARARRRGAPVLRRALALSDPRSESPWETLLRLFHRAIGVDVTPQVDLHAPDGRFLARADLLIDGTRTLQEYDGAAHLGRDQYRLDRQRDSGLAANGYVRHGWTAPDVTRDYGRIMKAADRALGRRSDDRRLVGWRTELVGSWFGGRKLAHRRAS